MTLKLPTRRALGCLGLLAVALLPLGNAAEAQAPRLGYLDPDIIIVQMPEYAQVRDSLQAREREIAAELQAQEDEIRAKFQELQEMQGSPVLTAEARQEREQEILQLQANLEQRQQAGLQDLGRREARLLQPLLMRLQDAIDAVSGEMGLTMVFAARANNAPVILFASDDAVNITEEVMTELGLEIPADTGGGAGN
ncbi:MAG TPA: OmpH family outer membrane protein [Rubricoccaceae bacterium]|nr:OmpH family outer membrane protein [Rubricoccaceae bacterium]